MSAHCAHCSCWLLACLGRLACAVPSTGQPHDARWPASRLPPPCLTLLAPRCARVDAIGRAACHPPDPPAASATVTATLTAASGGATALVEGTGTGTGLPAAARPAVSGCVAQGRRFWVGLVWLGTAGRGCRLCLWSTAACSDGLHSQLRTNLPSISASCLYRLLRASPPAPGRGSSWCCRLPLPS